MDLKKTINSGLRSAGLICIGVAICMFFFLSASLISAEQTGLGGDVLFSKPVKSVVFSHKTHVQDLSMSCNACHDKLFLMDAGATEKLTDFNHQSFEKGKYCGACHGKSASPMNTECTKCHIGVKGHAKLLKQSKP